MPKLNLTGALAVRVAGGRVLAIKWHGDPAPVWTAPPPPLPALAYDVDFRPFKPAQLFADLAGTTPATTGGAVARITGLSTPAINAAQTIVAARPMRRAAGDLGWLEFDGVDDRLDIAPDPAWRKSGMSIVAVFRRSLTAGRMMLFGNISGSTRYAGAMSSGSASTTLGTLGATGFYKNGAALPGPLTQGALYTAWTTGGWVIAEVAGLDLTTSLLDGGGQFPGYGGASWLAACDFGAYLMIPTATLNTGTNRADLVAALAAQFGITP